MSRTRKLLGPPGTGKTTTALRAVEDQLKSGTRPNEIAYTSFTRKAAHEAIDRATLQFGFSKDEFPYFGTLHSLSFHLQGLTPDRVMSTKHYAELGELLGPYEFRGKYGVSTERAALGGALGDDCLFIYQLARSMLVPLEQAWRVVQDNPSRFGPTLMGAIPLHVVQHFVAGLEKYKKVHDLLDFADFLDNCTSVLDVELFILDEAQDLTPQQWRFARQLGKIARQVLIAGDDDQALYGWAGSDVELLFAIVGRQEVLPISHRLPRAVHSYVANIARRIQRRIPKHYEPRDEEGSVHLVADELDVDLSKGEWMLLARTHYITHRLVKAARRAGVVYEIGGMWSNEDPTVLAVLAYERMRKGEKVLASFAAMACKFSGAYCGSKAEYVGWSDIIWPFQDNRDWMEGLHLMGSEQREYIRSLLRNGESLTKPGRIRISTIHQSKGGQADNVMVIGDIGQRVEESYWTNMDAELRVWYVAMSRARESLFIVQPKKMSPLQPIFCA